MMNINAKDLIIGAGILLLWGLVGAWTGGTAAVTPTLWIIIGLAPAYYFANIYGVAGYVGTFALIYIWQASLILPSGA